jgi:hypothetical protein
MSNYDGDKRTDIAVWQPINGTFHVLTSASEWRTPGEWKLDAGYTPAPGDVPQGGDYTGDGKDDFTVYRPSTGTWYGLTSDSNWAAPWTRTLSASGYTPAPNDDPVSGDYTGDGKDDFTVYRPSTGDWYVETADTAQPYAANPAWTRKLGTYVPGYAPSADDVALGGDYDGDSKDDLAVYRPSTGDWYVLRSDSNYTTVSTWKVGATGSGYAWAPEDVPVPGDYNGDSKTDLAVYRPSTGDWYVAESVAGSESTYANSWTRKYGIAGDVPVSGDYTGDEKEDIAVWRPSDGTWSWLRSDSNWDISTPFTAPQKWGTSEYVYYA